MSENKTKKVPVQKVLSITMIVLFSLFAVGVLLGIILELAAPETAFAVWSKENVWDVTTLPSAWRSHQKTVIHCLILIVVIYAVSKLLRLIFKKMMQKSNRAKTVITLLDGIIKYGAAIALIFLVLQACGVNTAAIWESVGVITLIVGLGAQSLIADIIAGVFIIFEDEYSVGEIVSIDDFRGTVSEIGIRATKILDMAGNIKIINNSDIKNVVNLSRELSLAVVDCEFPYDVPLEFVEKLLKDHLEDFKASIPAIVEGPFYKGVSGYGSSNVAVKLVAKCSEENRYQVQRDLLREYRQLFVQNGIDLSYDQVVVNPPSKSEIHATKKMKAEASEFVAEQKAASEGIEEQQR
ncbi:MAG: mechanosensitive ion channel family protein [Clostridia bacterium]|nr:mechanosensitive ion channel family protein [Clostridia bacterium]MDY6184913.1 mechanosensitive ion channel family protein [Eubacteriales bacterium]